MHRLPPKGTIHPNQPGAPDGQRTEQPSSRHNLLLTPTCSQDQHLSNITEESPHLDTVQERGGEPRETTRGGRCHPDITSPLSHIPPPPATHTLPPYPPPSRISRKPHGSSCNPLISHYTKNPTLRVDQHLGYVRLTRLHTTTHKIKKPTLRVGIYISYQINLIRIDLMV